MAKRLQIHVVIVIDSSCIKFLTNCISIDMFTKQKHLFEWMRLKMLCRSRFQCWWSWTWGGGCEVEVKVEVWWGWGWGWSWGGGHEVALSLLGSVVSRCCISARSYSTTTDNVYDAQTCLPPSQTQTQRLLVGFHKSFAPFSLNAFRFILLCRTLVLGTMALVISHKILSYIKLAMIIFVTTL